MPRLVRCFCRDETAATAIEYGLIAALMSVALIASFPAVTTALGGAFTAIGAKMAVN